MMTRDEIETSGNSRSMQNILAVVVIGEEYDCIGVELIDG